MKWWDWMSWSSFFECWISSQLFHSPLWPSSRGSLIPLHFLSSGWGHPHTEVIDISPGNFDSTCTSSSPVFCMMYSAYKLNKQSDSIQPWCTPFSILNQFVAPCPVLTVASWSAYRFFRRQIRWSGIPISFRNFQLFCDPHKGFSVVN